MDSSGFSGKSWSLTMKWCRLSLRKSATVVPPCPSYTPKQEHFFQRSSLTPSGRFMFNIMATLSSLQPRTVPWLVVAEYASTSPFPSRECLLGSKLGRLPAHSCSSLRLTSYNFVWKRLRGLTGDVRSGLISISSRTKSLEDRSSLLTDLAVERCSAVGLLKLTGRFEGLPSPLACDQNLLETFLFDYLAKGEPCCSADCCMTGLPACEEIALFWAVPRGDLLTYLSLEFIQTQSDQIQQALPILRFLCKLFHFARNRVFFAAFTTSSGRGVQISSRDLEQGMGTSLPVSRSTGASRYWNVLVQNTAAQIYAPTPCCGNPSSTRTALEVLRIESSTVFLSRGLMVLRLITSALMPYFWRMSAACRQTLTFLLKPTRVTSDPSLIILALPIGTRKSLLITFAGTQNTSPQIISFSKKTTGLSSRTADLRRPLQSSASQGETTTSPGTLAQKAAKHCECWAATEAAGPLSPLKTMGQRRMPLDMCCNFAHEFMMWSTDCRAKFQVMNSQMGLRPIRAAPTASPVNPASVMGVSKSLASPNLACRPLVTLQAPSYRATSSPIMKTLWSCSSYSSMASLRASRLVSLTGGLLGGAFPLNLMLGWQASPLTSLRSIRYFIIIKGSPGHSLNADAGHCLVLAKVELVPQLGSELVELDLLQHLAQLPRDGPHVLLPEVREQQQPTAVLERAFADFVDEEEGRDGEEAGTDPRESVVEEGEFEQVPGEVVVFGVEVDEGGEQVHELEGGGLVHAEGQGREDVGLALEQVLLRVDVRADVGQVRQLRQVVGLLELAGHQQRSHSGQLQPRLLHRAQAQVPVQHAHRQEQALRLQLHLEVDIHQPLHQDRAHALLQLLLEGEVVRAALRVLLAEDIREDVLLRHGASAASRERVLGRLHCLQVGEVGPEVAVKQRQLIPRHLHL